MSTADRTLHAPVLRDEAVAALVTDASGWYVDATFGRGGHSDLILQSLDAAGRLLALDRDQEAVDYARRHFSAESRFSIAHKNFSEIDTAVKKLNPEGLVDGVLFDLGVSSPQLDQAHRGFSFDRDGPLDMRMDTSRDMPLHAWLRTVDVSTLAQVFRDFGEERYSKRLARKVVEQVAHGNISSTGELAEVIKQAHPRWERNRHPATRCFQALRIFINRELDHIGIALERATDILRPGARLVVISFHSLEDRLVKRFIRGTADCADVPRGLPVRVTQPLKALGKAVRPGEEEVSRNPRSRSSVMRVAVKL